MLQLHRHGTSHKNLPFEKKEPYQGAEPLFLQIDLALISSPYVITPMLTPEHGLDHKAEGA